MSYIRSTSNPENLYVYDSGDCIEFLWNVNGAESAIVSKRDFYSILDAYLKWDFDLNETGIKTETLSIRETEDFRILLSFKDDKSVTLWNVTWNEVLRDYERRKLFSWTERFKFLFDRLRYFNY